jgi:type IV pilus assembly protein PilC
MKKKIIATNEFISYFCLELSLLLHAGIQIEDGLYLLAEDETDQKRKELLEQIAESVAGGTALADALRETEAFPSYLCNLVETGMVSGRLEQTFQTLSDYYNSRVQLGNQIKNTMFYQLVLMGLMIVIIVTLLTKVLPIFDTVYMQLGGSMEGSGALLLKIGQVLNRYLPVLCAVLAVVVVAAVVVLRFPKARKKVQDFYTARFGHKGIVRRLGTVQMVQALTMGIASGLHTEDAFSLAAMFHGENEKLKKSYEECQALLGDGAPLAEAMKKTQLLPAAYCRILELGIKSGTADTALAEVSRRMQEDVETEIYRKVGYLESAIVVGTSIIVGIILLAVMVPLINIMSSIG